MSEQLQKNLHELSQTIRGKNKAPDDHPLSLYQTLIHNNLSSVVSPCFPVLRSLLKTGQWDKFINGFLQNYQAKFTSYHRVPEHFVDYLSQLDNLPYPFIAELAHYEWLELAVETAQLPEAPLSLIHPVADTLFTMPPSARFQLYDYPVHLIDQTHIPEKPDATALIVYRPFDQRKIEFMKINLLSYHCLHFLVNEGLTLNQYLQAVAEQQNEPITDAIKEQYCQLLASLHQQSIIQPLT